MIFFGVILTVLAGMVLLPSPSPAEDWPQLRGPNRNGFSAEKDLNLQWGPDGPPELWRATIGTGFSSITIRDGQVYSMGHVGEEDVVWCFKADSGEKVWERKYPTDLYAVSHEGGPSSTPTVDEDSVYTLSRLALLQCLDAKTGEVRWSHNLGEVLGTHIPKWGISNSTLVVGDHLIVDAGVTAAFNKRTGEVVWKTENYGEGYSSPLTFSLDDKTRLGVFNGMGFIALDLENGHEICRYPWPTNFGVNSAVPIIRDRQVYISSSYGQGSALITLGNANPPETVWTSKGLENHVTGAILLDGYLYGFNGHFARPNCFFQCNRLADGEMQWVEKSVNKGSVIYADGKLLILTGNGELISATPSPQGYQEISRGQVLGGKCWTEMALANKRLYARNAQGILICLNLANKP